MNVEVIRIRQDKDQNIQISGDTRKVDSTRLIKTIIPSLNERLNELSTINEDSRATVDDYASKIAEIIYEVLNVFNEMNVYPDYFYDIYFKINDEFRDLQSKGMISGGKGLYDIPGFEAKVSESMERGITAGNYKLNPTKVKNISNRYNEMVSFARRHHLPCEINTVDMCQEMYYNIETECRTFVSALGTKPYISDDIEILIRLLFDYMTFYAAVGVNPKDYLDDCMLKQEELGKHK